MSEKWRHRSRGTIYEVIGMALMQVAKNNPGASLDERSVVVYRSIGSGSLWVRPTHEFYDGRFERVKDESAIAEKETK